MKKIFFVCAIFSLTAGMLSACTTGSRTIAPTAASRTITPTAGSRMITPTTGSRTIIPTVGSRTITLTAADAGKSITLNMGDTLVIKLEGNPTTGYNWLVTSVDKAILEQQGEPVFKADSTLVGSGGMLTLTFKAIAAGTTNLQLGYMRSWETGVAPLQTYEVTIVVK